MTFPNFNKTALASSLGLCVATTTGAVYAANLQAPTHDNCFEMYSLISPNNNHGTITGTYAYNALVKCFIPSGLGPQGDAGAAGSQGAQGATGAQGSQGAQGAQGGTQGFAGFRGAQGAQGAQGSQGPAGIRGAQGDEGTQGSQGSQGSQGPQGSAGIRGTQGDEGTQGTQGPQGFDGTQGFTGDVGDQGTQGAQGPQGAQGNIGTQGFDGQQGPTGPQGSQGAQGVPGTQGAAEGLPGPQGPQGASGPQGPQGFQGPQGAQGVQGAPGASIKNWQAACSSGNASGPAGCIVDTTSPAYLSLDKKLGGLAEVMNVTSGQKNGGFIKIFGRGANVPGVGTDISVMTTSPARCAVYHASGRPLDYPLQNVTMTQAPPDMTHVSVKAVSGTKPTTFTVFANDHMKSGYALNDGVVVFCLGVPNLNEPKGASLVGTSAIWS